MTRRPTVPGFRLLTRLGGGPHADVYAAEPTEGGEPLAVKVLRPEHEDDVTVHALFRREARAGMAVRHRHLVSIVRANTSTPPFFLVMELLGGRSAKRRVQDYGRLPLSVALAVGRQTAEALAALHAAGFVHGDVKSDNVRLVSPGRAVLVDLGFAHRPGDLISWAETGHMMGTPNYLAPELCVKPPIDSFAADIFGLGVTLFELITGKLPYPSGPVRDVIRRRRSDRPADLRRMPGDWPAGLPELLAAMTAPDPTDRPRAKQLVRKLIAQQLLAMRKRAG
jgi:serine/threonine protein kinase